MEKILQNCQFVRPNVASLSLSQSAHEDRELTPTEQLILDLSDHNLREHALSALSELSKRREHFEHLAPLLWISVATIAALMQEVTLIYPFLSPPSLTAASSSRVCNALNLFRCVAYHVDTKWSFLRANIHLYLYPFIDTTSKGSQYENLRLSSLGVIGALVKVDDPEVISSLLSADIIPVCLRGMEIGGELSQTVATFIVQKIMLNEEGLSYICSTIRQFYLVSDALSRIVQSLAEQEKPSQQLLKHIIYCYHRLADHPRACDTLIGCLPEIFRDPTFCNCIDEETREDFLKPLFYKLHVRSLEWQASSHMNSVIYHM